jgi:hypothetical protein
MAPEPISTAYFTNPLHQSVFLYMYSLIICYATATHNNRMFERVFFYAARFISKKLRHWFFSKLFYIAHVRTLSIARLYGVQKYED